MPRRPRPDREPEILLPDDRDAQRRSDQAIGPRYRGKIRRRGYNSVTDGFTMIFDETQRRLAMLKRANIRIGEGLLLFMMQHCVQSAHVPVLGENREQLTRDGMLVYRLHRVGCRIEMTQDRIAVEYGCSRQHVNEQIALMREHGFIVNQGHGWYEFDANLCWRGDYEVRRAYVLQQVVRDGREILEDGRVVHRAEDMTQDEASDDA